ncbi:hypothetical protein SAY87_004991 [Trapa incisa]|uniref:Trichome birefringence-like N-terminal domain-containing protein n=1 Tax=Trapa incisa TaxID=236973 RepID=A0AAN7JQG4_9MYRT|nr:hypothetical protein SAY87_004991 [Trapa incisa]
MVRLQEVTPYLVLAVPLTFILITTLFFSLSSTTNPIFLPLPTSPAAAFPLRRRSPSGRPGECDIFSGEWVPDPRGPRYTNRTCWAIQEHQNCMKYGRPDDGFVKWRWKPEGCELPAFDPARFLRLMRGKSVAFVGDSVARNQMQSLICLLSPVEYPEAIWNAPDQQSVRWRYAAHNFTLAIFWSPYLVRSAESDPVGPTNNGLFSMYLDELDEQWTNHIDEFDYVVVSAGHWFFRPLVFYESGRAVGCYMCLAKNLTDLTRYYGYRKAFRMAFKAINGRKGYRGVTILRTFAPSHFEGGMWNTGGRCDRTGPVRADEGVLRGAQLKLYTIQLEEFQKAEEAGRRRGRSYRLLDVTPAMLLRPDGHPSVYGHRPEERVKLYNDCVHWCLPGPIDAWNDLLLKMLEADR